MHFYYIEFVAQQSKKSDIPVPIKERLRSEKNTGDSLEGFYSSQNNKRDKIAMNPNNAQYTPVSKQSWFFREEIEIPHQIICCGLRVQWIRNEWSSLTVGRMMLILNWYSYPVTVLVLTNYCLCYSYRYTDGRAVGEQGLSRSWKLSKE